MAIRILPVLPFTLVNVSAGFNPDDGPTAARIHAGLSFGL